MSGFERQQVNTLLTRLEERPERLIVVSGPRQTGKTTLVTQALARTNMGGDYRSIDEPESATPSPTFDQQEQVNHHTY